MRKIFLVLFLLSVSFSLENNTDIIKTKEIDYSGFFEKIYLVNYYNNGTQNESMNISIPFPLIDKLFIYELTEGFVYENNSLNYNFILEPEKDRTIYYRTNYFLVFCFPFFVFGGVYLYFVFSRKIIVSKRIVSFQEIADFCVFEIEIALENKSNKELLDLEAVEVLPDFVLSTFSFKTIKPKIKKKDKLIFEIEKINPKGKRIINYKIKTKGLTGTFIFPRTKVEFKSKDGNINIAESPYVIFNTKV